MSMGCSLNQRDSIKFYRLSLLVHIKGLQVRMPRKKFLSSQNSADPDEMPHNAAFHLSLQCLSKDLFRGIQYTKS